MDPNTALQLLRRNTMAVSLTEDKEELAAIAVEMAEIFQALDDWLKKGGFLPVNWDR